MTVSPESDSIIEELVFACLESDDPQTELSKVTERHPEHAERVRRIYGLLVDKDLVGRELVGGDLAGAAAAAGWTEPEQVGEFVLEERLGHGGMGLVYRATQRSLERQVALKLVRPELLGVPGARDRFRREAEAVASLQHPGIVHVLTVGEEQGLPFLAMEFIEGRSLAEILHALAGRDPSALTGRDLAAVLGAERPADDLFAGSWTNCCVTIARRLAAALAHAHARGVLHRDVKPSNVLLDRHGGVKLADFGLARVEGAQDLTRSTTQLGSLPYLPPENLAPKPPLPAASLDVYALGVTLYETLALRHPFRDENAEQTRRNILDGRPASLRADNPSVNRDLETVCLVAMDADPDERYRGIDDFARDLENLAAHRPIEARRPGWGTRTWRWVQRHPTPSVATAVALLLAAIGFAVFALQQQDARRTAETLGRALRERTDRYNLLEHVVDFRAVKRERDLLIPAWPTKTAAIRSWLETRWQPLHDTVPALKATIDTLGDSPAEASAGTTDATADLFLHDTLQELVDEIGAFALEPVAQTRRDLEWSQRVRELTEHHAQARHAWAETGLAPQIGLVPIGRNPVSGHWEFYHLRSAASPDTIPTHDPDTGTIEVTDGTGIVFVLIPGGNLTMGAQKDDPAAPNFDPLAHYTEQPVQVVPLDPYLIARHELTKGQWKRLSNGGEPSFYKPGHRYPGNPVAVSYAHPVEMVSWDDAQTLFTRHGLALPTEAQWEFACRAGTTTPWVSGDTPEELAEYANVLDRTATKVMPGWGAADDIDDRFVSISPAGAFTPNAWGLHDMHGNVWEWCADAYSPHAGTRRAADGLYDSPQASERIIRSGSFQQSSQYARSSTRINNRPHTRTGGLGVRAARRILP